MPPSPRPSLALRAAAAALLLSGPAPFLGAAGSAIALEPAAVGVVPEKGDKCPVCGMFVARYPEWVAAVRFKDGSHAVFDGAKDLFKFLTDPSKYLPARKKADVAGLYVTDYYAVKQVDAFAAFFVLGGDVLGPMGHELVPFASEAEAKEFQKDHHGRRVLRFDEVTPAVLAELE